MEALKDGCLQLRDQFKSTGNDYYSLIFIFALLLFNQLYLCMYSSTLSLKKLTCSMLCNFVFHQVEAEKLQLDSAPFGKRFYRLSFLIDTNLIV